MGEAVLLRRITVDPKNTQWQAHHLGQADGGDHVLACLTFARRLVGRGRYESLSHDEAA